MNICTVHIYIHICSVDSDHCEIEPFVDDGDMYNKANMWHQLLMLATMEMVE